MAPFGSNDSTLELVAGKDLLPQQYEHGDALETEWGASYRETQQALLQRRYQEQIMQTPEYRAMMGLQTFMPPTLLVLGTIGNILAFVVLLQRQLRLQHSTALYMLVLVTINTLVLYLGCGLSWLAFISQITHVSNLADWLCKVWQFTFNTLQYSSSWLVVLLTIDRYIFMWHPLKAPNICTVFTAKLLTIAIYIGVGVVCIHTMWIYELQTDHGCMIDQHQQDFETVAWPWVLATVCSYIPLLLIIIFIIFLVVGLCACTNCSSNQGNDTNLLQEQFTRLVLCVGVLHLLCALPTVIINLVEYFSPRTSNIPPVETIARLYLVKEVASEANNIFLSCIFLLYFLLVPTLRREFIRLCSGNSAPLEIIPSPASEQESVEAKGSTSHGKELLSVTTSNQEPSQSTFV